MARWTTAQLAYLAGILDGEGSFLATPKVKTAIRVQVLDEVLIDWLHETFGGHVSKGYVNKRGRRVFGWTLQRKAALAELLPLLVPYLVIKRAQCEALIELVTHLETWDRWPTRTSRLRSTDPERQRRRDCRKSWRARREVLARAVREARPQPGTVAV